MNKYSIEINFTSNENKTGKIIIKGPNVNLKGDIAIPKELHKMNRFYLNNIEINQYIKNNISINNFYKKDQSFLNKYKMILGEEYFGKSQKYPILKDNSINRENTKNLFFAFDEAFTIKDPIIWEGLKKIAEDDGCIKNIVAKSKWFIFGQKNVSRENADIHQQYKKIGENIAKEEYRIKNETFEEKFKKNNITIKNLDSSISSVSKNKKNNSNINKKNQNKTYNNDGLDAFDLMFMNAFPDLAPVYKPTSGIAWMIYLSNQDNNLKFFRNPNDCIREIKGFENVGYCEINSSNSGNFSGAGATSSFNVDLYQDEGKRNLLGKISYNEEIGLRIDDNQGNITVVLTNKENNKYSSLTEGLNHSKAILELEQNNNGYIGSWTIEPKNSIPVSSSISIDKDLSLSSNLSSNNNTMNYESSFESIQKLEDRFAYREEYVPPPPPPPPPEDQFSYNTSDPYSSSSLRM